MNRFRTAVAGAGVVMTLAATTAQPSAASSSNAHGATLESAVVAADEFLALLSEEQRAATVFEFADLIDKRFSWSNFEDGEFSRLGARLGDLDEDQRAAAMAAVASLLSPAGYEYVQGMMAAEDELTASGYATFGSDGYYLAFYGEPSIEQPWTLQFGGHHLAINISVGGEVLSVSPYFKGVQPISFEVDGTTVEPMAQDVDDVFGLFEALDDEQLAAAEMAGPLDDLVMGPQIDTGYPESEGLPFTELTADQQELVRAVIADWVDDAAPDLAGPLLDVYEAQLDETVIGWSISIDRDAAAYMRIDGPRVWIEWLNMGNPGQSGFHPHTIYRDKLVDYGTGTTA